MGRAVERSRSCVHASDTTCMPAPMSVPVLMRPARTGAQAVCRKPARCGLATKQARCTFEALRPGRRAFEQPRSSGRDAGMRVLVTGHLGYIGVEAVTVLRAAGHDVVGLDIGFFNECDFAAPPDQIPEIKVDLRDVTPSDLKGVDAI